MKQFIDLNGRYLTLYRFNELTADAKRNAYFTTLSYGSAKLRFEKNDLIGTNGLIVAEETIEKSFANSQYWYTRAGQWLSLQSSGNVCSYELPNQGTYVFSLDTLTDLEQTWHWSDLLKNVQWINPEHKILSAKEILKSPLYDSYFDKQNPGVAFLFYSYKLETAQLIKSLFYKYDLGTLNTFEVDAPMVEKDIYFIASSNQFGIDTSTNHPHHGSFAKILRTYLSEFMAIAEKTNEIITIAMDGFEGRCYISKEGFFFDGVFLFNCTDVEKILLSIVYLYELAPTDSDIDFLKLPIVVRNRK